MKLRKKLLITLLITTIVYGISTTKVEAVEIFNKIKNVKVQDGDNIIADICGYENTVYEKESIRLYGIDAPETRTRNKLEKLAGKLVKRFLSDKAEGKQLYIKYIKQGKFGRAIAYVYIDSVNINEYLEEFKLVKSFTGKVKKEKWTVEELFYIIKSTDYYRIVDGYEIYHKKSLDKQK